MGEVFSEAVKKKGIFNYGDLYNFLYDWFQDMGYMLHENMYVEKKSDFGTEIKLKWQAKKHINDYYIFVIDAEWHILGMNSTEIEVDGRQEKTNKGEVKIKVKGSLVTDKEGRWEQSSMYKQLHGMYQKYIVRSTTEEHEMLVFEECSEFIDDLKSFLGLM